MSYHNQAQAIILDAIAEDQSIKELAERLKLICEDGDTLHVNEECGFTGLAYSDRNTALYALFNSMDNGSIYDQLDEPFAVALIYYQGQTFYRFSEDLEHGASCRLRQMIGDLAWFEDEWRLAENSDGYFAVQA